MSSSQLGIFWNCHDDTSKWRVSLRENEKELLCYEYASGADVSAVVPCLRWCSLEELRQWGRMLAPSLDVHLQSGFLLGTLPTFKSFFTGVLPRLQAEFNGVNPLPHTLYLALLDCEANAETNFRRVFLTPLVAQVEIVGHVQWAHFYLIREDWHGALHHLEEAQIGLENQRISLDASTEIEEVPRVLSQSTWETLWDAMCLLKCRVLRIQRELNPTDERLLTQLDSSAAAFQNSNRSNYQTALNFYHQALLLEKYHARMNSSDTAEFPIRCPQLLNEAIALLSEIGTPGENAAVALLKSACYLSLARYSRSVDAILAERYRQESLELLGSLPTAEKIRCHSLVVLTAAGLRFEYDDVANAYAELFSEWQNGNWQENQSFTARVRLALLHNLAISSALKGDIEMAAEWGIRLFTQRDFQESQVESARYSNFGTRLSALCGQRVAQLDQDTLQTLRHYSGRQLERTIAPIWLALQNAKNQSDSIQALLNLLPMVDICRLRHLDGATPLDLSAVRFCLFLLRQEACRSDGLLSFNNINPYWLPDVWNELSSETRWMMYWVVTRIVMQAEDLGEDEFLWKSILKEYARHIVVPLRCAHRRKTGEAKWSYVPSLGHKRISADPQSVKTMRRVVPNYPHYVPERSENLFYVAADLYDGELEYGLLHALLNQSRRGGFALPMLHALENLATIERRRVEILIGYERLKERRSTLTQANVQNPQELRGRALATLRDLRNFDSHSQDGTTLPPKKKWVLAAWHYLLVSVFVYAGKLDPSFLEGQSGVAANENWLRVVSEELRRAKKS